MSDYGMFGEKLKIESDLTDFATFVQTFSNIDTTNMNGGDEQSLDAIYFSIRNLIGGGSYNVESAAWFSSYANNGSEPAKEDWVINWREDTKRVVIVFLEDR